MFIEYEKNDGKLISINVNNIVFVGEMKEKVSLYFTNGTFLHLPDEYVSIVKRFIELSKVEISSSLYVQFSTKKDERIAFPIKRIFSILEEENTTAILFDDGTRIEVLEDYTAVIARINGKLEQGLNAPNRNEETKS